MNPAFSKGSERNCFKDKAVRIQSPACKWFSSGLRHCACSTSWAALTLGRLGLSAARLVAVRLHLRSQMSAQLLNLTKLAADGVKLLSGSVKSAFGPFAQAEPGHGHVLEPGQHCSLKVRRRRQVCRRSFRSTQGKPITRCNYMASNQPASVPDGPPRLAPAAQPGTRMFHRWGQRTWPKICGALRGGLEK